MPKVSVIIPCFNQGQFLREAVDSVVAQTYEDLEMIIVNDGSDDKQTLWVLDNLSVDRARIIHTENQGAPCALNRGVAESEGKYILPLDSDDKIASTYIAKAVEVLDSEEDAGIVYCQAELFGERTGRWELPEYQFPDILLGNVIFDSALFRKSDWKRVNGYNSNMKLGLQDFDFWLSLIELGRKVVCLPEVMFFYRKHPGSKSRKIGKHELVALYTHLFHNHPKLYSDNIGSIFEHIIALREQSQLKAERIESLAQELVQRDAAIDWLSAQVSAKDQIIRARDEAVSYLSENKKNKEKALRDRMIQLEDKDKTIRAQQELIKTLKENLGSAQDMIRRFAALNELLETQLETAQQAERVLSSHLGAKDAELSRIMRSVGWRLLSRFGSIKYRYLLPVYRLLGLMPFDRHPVEQQQPTVTDSMSTGEQEQTLRSMAAQVAELRQEIDAISLEESGRGASSGHHERKQFDPYQSLTLLPHLSEEQLPGILEMRAPDGPLHRTDVICFSIIDWEFRYQRPQQIMSQFAANGHRVFYISTSRFRHSTANPRLVVSKIQNNLYEVQLSTERPLDVYSEVIDANTVLESLAELRRTFHIDEAVAYVMIASWGQAALETSRLWNWRVVYDCMDEWENFPGINRQLLDMEVNLVERCDLLVVTAQRLYDKWRPYQRPAVLARNAVDYAFYAELCRPNRKLSEIKHPVVGYYGAIADWFDVELVTFAAKQRPQYSFVLLGGVFDVDVTPLQKLPNVLLLGQQPYETMPQYLYHFDACIIPFKLNAITEATDPVKLYEYLSAGKPVVSVALPELAPFSNYLYIASDKHDFVSQLDKAVGEDDYALVDLRREFAKENTWRERYALIADGLRDSTPRASIIVITYDNLAMTKLCLESIIRNTEYPNYEVVVVDNSSSDGTPGYLRYLAAQDSKIHIILNSENAGFARANNQGIAARTSDYIVLLNNDTVVPPGWLSRLLRHLRDPEVGIVGPMSNFVGNEARLAVTYETWGEMERFAREYTDAHDGQVADINMLAMYCVAFRRDTNDEIGPLDEQFGLGMFEDDDYAQRMRAAGYRVICAADVFVHHFGQASFKKLIERGEYDDLFEENRQRYEAKWNIQWTLHKSEGLDFRSAWTPLALEGLKAKASYEGKRMKDTDFRRSSTSATAQGKKVSD